MKRFVPVVVVLLLCVGVWASDKCIINGQKGKVEAAKAIDVAVNGAKATPQDMLFKKDTSSSVAKICDAMHAGDFKIVRGIACGDEKVGYVEKNVNGNKWQAIEYGSNVFEKRYAASKVTKDGKQIDRLSELKLILAGSIPNTEFGGGWMPTRTYNHEGTNVVPGNTCFLYGLIGKNAKVEKVLDLGENKVVYHVTQDSVLPYFAVETKKFFSVARMDVRTFYAECNGCDKAYTFKTVQELRDMGSIPENATLGRTIGKTKETVGEFMLFGRSVEVKWTEPHVAISVTCYPYFE